MAAEQCHGLVPDRLDIGYFIEGFRKLVEPVKYLAPLRARDQTLTNPTLHGACNLHPTPRPRDNRRVFTN